MNGKKNSDERKAEEEIYYFGPGLKNEEIDDKFGILYNKLLDYRNSIFDLVEQLCPNYDDQARLALSIAETDGNLLQRLVAKECETRRELMKVAGANVDQQEVTEDRTSTQYIDQVLGSRTLSTDKAGDLVQNKGK